jgi:hypothetical protein
MERNPYAPPNTEVADAPIPEAMQRPREIGVAVALLVGSVFVGVVRLPLVWANVPPGQAGVAVVTYIIVVAIVLAFAGGIYSRRNWVRIVYLVVIGLGLLVTLPRIPLVLRASAMQGIIELIQTGMQIGAAALTLTGPSNRWFRHARSRN